ncbi:MAG: hypothetical protein ACREQB_04065 [Candidatus Binataceae bacterium]
MASTITDARVISAQGTVEQREVSEGMRSARNCMLDEMPGFVCGLVTVAYIVISLARLAL